MSQQSQNQNGHPVASVELCDFDLAAFVGGAEKVRPATAPLPGRPSDRDSNGPHPSLRRR
jgi:hypothetical protein